MPTIKTGAQKFFLDVPLCSTVNVLKESIAAKEGVPAAQQKIIFAGRQLLDGGKLLSDYNVTKDADVLLMIKSVDLAETLLIHVRSLTNSHSFAIKCKRSEQIANLFSYVNLAVALECSYTLLYRGQALDPQRRVYDYHLDNEDTIYIVHKIVIQVERRTGQKIRLQVCIRH